MGATHGCRGQALRTGSSRSLKEIHCGREAFEYYMWFKKKITEVMKLSVLFCPILPLVTCFRTQIGPQVPCRYSHLNCLSEVKPLLKTFLFSQNV